MKEKETNKKILHIFYIFFFIS